jgi:hypothetical protein
MQSAGIAIPAPAIANLLIDTGASGTAIDSTIVTQLGLQPTGTTTIRTPSTGMTPHTCSTYDVELTIPGAGTARHIPALAIIDGHYLSQGIQGLLGRDILKDARLIYGGPDNYCMLSF